MSSTFGKRWSALKWDPQIWREYPASAGEHAFLSELHLLRAPSPMLPIHQYMVCVQTGVERVKHDYTASVAFWKEMNLKSPKGVALHEVLLAFTDLDGLPPSADVVGEVHWKMQQIEMLGRVQLQRPMVALPNAIDIWLETYHRNAEPPLSQFEGAPAWLQRYNALFLHRNESFSMAASRIEEFIAVLDKEDTNVVLSIGMKVLPRLGAHRTNTMEEASVRLMETLVPKMRGTFFWLHTRGLFLHAPLLLNSERRDRVVHCLTTLATNSLEELDKPLLAYLITPYLGSNTVFEAWQHLEPSLRQEHVHRELLTTFKHPAHPQTLDNEPPAMQRFWDKMHQELQRLRPWPSSMLNDVARNIRNTPLGRTLATAMDPRMEVIVALDDTQWLSTWHNVLNKRPAQPMLLPLPIGTFTIAA